MATNPYFKQYTQTEQQDLASNLVKEAIKIHGIDMYYLPRDIDSRDSVLGTANQSTFDSIFTIEMMITTIDAFDGQGDIISRFGIEIEDQATFVVHKDRFDSAVIQQSTTTLTRPREGDLLYFPFSKSLFEIKFVEHEQPFYQLGKNYVWELRTELYKYSGETFNTGDSTIDSGMAALAASGTGNDQADIFETTADGSDSASFFDDTRDSGRGTGIIDFTEDSPFGAF